MDQGNEFFRKRFRRSIEVGFHYLDLPQYDQVLPELMSGFDPREIVRNLKKANVDSCYIWPLLLDTYFFDAEDTELGHKHKALRGRDIFRELTEEARRAGLSVIAWTNPNYGLTDYAAAHPSEVMKDRSGEPVPGHICFNSEHFMGLIEKRSSGILAAYDVDGIVFDGITYPTWPSLTPCYCDTCKAMFKRESGFDMPVEPSWDETWDEFIRFRYDSCARFAVVLGGYLKARHPGKIVVFNYHGHVPGYFTEWKTGIRPVGHAHLSDFTIVEDFGFRLHQLYPSLSAALLAGERPGRSFQVMTDRFVSSYGCFTLRPKADLQWGVFTAKIRGANITVIDKIRHDFSVEPAVYDRIGEVFAELREKESWFDHPALKEVGLYSSLRTRDWYGRDESSRYDNSVVGAFRALVDSHFQVEFLFDESVSLETLGQFPVVYLANTAILVDAEAELLRQYVRAGGNVIATWETGLHDRMGRRLKDYSLGDLLGCRYLSHTGEEWNFVRFPKGPWSQGLYADHDLPVAVESSVVFECVGGESFGDLRVALPGGTPPGIAGRSPWKRVGPALCVHEYGKGRVIYIAAPIDAEYSTQRGMMEHRHVLRNCLENLLPRRQVSIKAPVNVETVVMRTSGGETIVHFVGSWPRKNVKNNWKAPLPTTECMEEPALYRAELTLDRAVRSVKALDHGTKVSFSGHAVTMETQQVHEALILSF